jgi:hypothetical protein
MPARDKIVTLGSKFIYFILLIILLTSGSLVSSPLSYGAFCLPLKKFFAAPRPDFEVDTDQLAKLESKLLQGGYPSEIVPQIMRARGWPVEKLTESQRVEFEFRFGKNASTKETPAFTLWVQALANPEISLAQKVELWDTVTDNFDSPSFTLMDGLGTEKYITQLMPDVHVGMKSVRDSLGELSLADHFLESAHDIGLRNIRKRVDAFTHLTHLQELRDYESTFKQWGLGSNSKIPPDNIFVGAQVASHLLDHPIHTFLSEADLNLLRDYAGAWKEYERSRYQGRNQILKSARFQEFSENVQARGTIDEFIRTEHFARGGWWGDFNVPAINSRSPIRQMYGRDSQRSISWAKNDSMFGESRPDLTSFTIVRNQVPNPLAVNEKDKFITKSIETFVKTNGKWEPFFYEKRGYEWVPSDTFNGKPIPQACAECHMKSNGMYTPSPIKKIPDVEALRASGLYDLITKSWRAGKNNRTINEFLNR